MKRVNIYMKENEVVSIIPENDDDFTVTVFGNDVKHSGKLIDEALEETDYVVTLNGRKVMNVISKGIEAEELQVNILDYTELNK